MSRSIANTSTTFDTIAAAMTVNSNSLSHSLIEDPLKNTSTNVTNITTTTVATSLLNNTWLHIEKTASALIANTHIRGKASITNSTSGIHTDNYSKTTFNPYISLSMPTSITADTTTDNTLVESIFEYFFNATTTTTASTILSSTINASLVNDLITTATATATETPYVPYVMRPETYIVPVLFALIFIVGVLGNGTLIVVFLSVRQMRNVPNTYIFSLALADLLVIVTTVPLTSTVYTVDSWPWGSFLCTLSEFFKDVSIGVSVFTLTALSGDRYFAIVDPLRKFHAHGGGKRATRMTIAIAVSIWLLAIFCGIPALVGTYIKKVDINSSKSFSLCYPFPEKWGIRYAKIMVLLRFLVYYAIPLVIIAMFYALIARHLMYAANVPGEMHGAVRQVRARRKVALTVLAFVVIFGICFLPIHVFMLWFYYWPTAQEDYNYFWHVLRIVGFCLSFANSCANPVALYFVSGAFRKHFNRYLFCEGSRTVCKHRDTSLTVSKRYYHSRRSCFHQNSTIRSRLQETTITMFTNGNNQNACNNFMGGSNGGGEIVLAGAGDNCRNDDTIDVALTSDYCHQRQHTHQLM